MAPQYSTHVVVVTASVAAATVLGYYLYRRNRDKIPEKWEPMGRVTHMYMYPIKSGRRVPIDKANCTEVGFQSTNPSLSHFRDRCLLIYQESTNEVKTGRNHPKILLIEARTVDQDHICLRTSDAGSITFKLPEVKVEKCINVKMHQTEIMPTMDCGDDVAKWVSNYVLSEPTGLRVGFHDGTHRRDIEKYYPNDIKLNPLMSNSAAGLYSDVATMHLLTKPSVDDVVMRIPNSNITLHNFRPNIVIEGDNIEPYAEDNWTWIKIGDVVMKNVMLVPRCAMTTINPETGEFSKNYEPITTMKKYRMKTPPSPILGIYTRLYNNGQIKMGDAVYIGK